MGCQRRRAARRAAEQRGPCGAWAGSRRGGARPGRKPVGGGHLGVVRLSGIAGKVSGGLFRARGEKQRRGEPSRKRKGGLEREREVNGFDREFSQNFT